METQDATEMLSVLEEEDGYENGKNILFLKKKNYVSHIFSLLMSNTERAATWRRIH